MERQLPGYGPLRRLSLGTKRVADAKAMENAVLELARRGLHEPRLFGILDALQGQGAGKRGAVSPADVLVAVRSPDGPDDGLARLLRRLDDPVLGDVINERLAAPTCSREDRLALPVVLAVAEARWGRGCRFSALASHEAIQHVLEAARMHGRTPCEPPRLANSVVRYEKRALSRLLTDRLGRHERNRVMADVAFAGSDDRRRIRPTIVTLVALGKLCDELDAGRWQKGDEAASLYVRIAASTGAEVPAIARARVGDLRAGEEGTATLFLRDTKKAKAGASRDRDALLARALAAEAFRYTRDASGAPRSETAVLFPLALSRFQTMFTKARKRAGLTEAVLDGQNTPTALRPHDLRRVYAFFGRAAGVSRETLGLAGLGHTRLDQTDTYIRSDVRVLAAEAEAIAAALGFGTGGEVN
jgi:integrase